MKLKKILNEKSAVIHFRRGDYTNKKNKEIFYQLGKEYYQKAIKLMRQRNRDIIFYIFSDDIGIARDFFALEKNAVFININQGKQL